MSLSDLRVLVVDDEADVRLGLQLLVEGLGAQVRPASSGEEAIEVLEQWLPHVMLSDITMGGITGMELLAETRRRWPTIRVLMITGYGTIELAVEALRNGAVHFVTKPFDNDEILSEVDRHGREALLAEQVRLMARSNDSGPATIIATDPRMAAVLDLVRQVAPTEMPVIIRGESGTGKELVARSIHEHSDKKDRPFLAVNSAALPDTLLESELFGHRKGAFTGANENREGIFAKACGGTVFLDEVALMSPAFQGKLLRVLQEKTVVPLGSSTPKAVNFRLVTATNRSLREAINEGSFREDLYYRLRVVPIDIPPLRERPQDIVALASHFLTLYSSQVAGGAKGPPSLNIGAIDELKRHRWPGNVRELENCMQRALILSGGAEIGPPHLGLHDEAWPFVRSEAESVDYQTGKEEALRHFRRSFVERTLKATGGNVTRAADRCGLTRAALQRIMRSLDLDRRHYSDG
ncbi:MAG: sigma-54-dependent Fis family transcriptional regulator [Acidobacteria bacterium]|nr:MAG: sigma-54-dependent Fis family transcriptional regulator [Acidobacteriota bacterium]